MEQTDHFTIECQGYPVKIFQTYLGEDKIFRVDFSDGRKPLILTIGMDERAKKFWSCMQPHRLTEAQEIGPLIALHYRKGNSK